MPRREVWRQEIDEAFEDDQRQKEEKRLEKQQIENRLAEKRARATRVRENAQSRVDALMAHIRLTRNGFIWTGERIQFIDPALFADGWRETFTEECETAIEVEEILLSKLGYTREYHYISSSKNGTSIQWEGNWFENGREYFVLEV